MKRTLLALVLLIAAGSLYAEITVGSLIDVAIIPFQLILNDDTKPLYPGGPEQQAVIMGAGAGRNASSQGARARIDVRASYEDTIGMRMRLQARTDGVSIEDYLEAWWKPLPWLRIDGGRFLDDRLRGKINDLDERMNAYTVRMYDADSIFTRFRTHWTGQAGVMMSFTPPVMGMENFWFAAMLYDLNPLSAASATGVLYDAHPDYINNNADAWKRIQVAAAYTIPDVGLIRVQYFGVKPGVTLTTVSDEWVDDSSTTFYSYYFNTFGVAASRIEAAFAYTGFPGLTVDIGAKLPLPFKNWDNGPTSIFIKEDETLLDPVYRAYKSGFVWQAPYQAAVGVRYQLNNLQIAGRVDTQFLGYMKGYSTEVFLAPQLNCHIWPSWDFSFARLILDFGYEWIGATYDKNKNLVGLGSPVALNGGSRFGTGILMQKTILPNCYVFGGVAFKFAGTVNGVDEKAVLTVPLYAEYAF